MNAFIQLTTADPSIGKIDINSMSHQTLMELLVSNFDDKLVFRDSDSYFTEISHWEGVTLNEHQEVTAIEWEGNLFGYAAVEGRPKKGGSVDLQWLPSTLRSLYISSLLLRGTIDTHGLPRRLVNLDVRSNEFEGTLETSGLPRELRFLFASRNKLTGTLDFSMLPPALKFLYLSCNTFSGTVDFDKIPKKYLEDMRLSFNQFSGEMNLRVVPQCLQCLELEGNRFNTEKSLIVRKGRISHYFLDKGDIQEVANTDGEPIYFVFESEKFIRLNTFFR